jgi:hypothetical protein
LRNKSLVYQLVIFWVYVWTPKKHFAEWRYSLTLLLNVGLSEVTRAAFLKNFMDCNFEHPGIQSSLAGKQSILHTAARFREVLSECYCVFVATDQNTEFRAMFKHRAVFK